MLCLCREVNLPGSDSGGADIVRIQVPLLRPERITAAVDARRSEDRMLDLWRKVQGPPPRVSREGGRPGARGGGPEVVRTPDLENEFDHRI